MDFTNKQRETLKKFLWEVYKIQSNLMNEKKLSKSTDLDTLAIESLWLSKEDWAMCKAVANSSWVKVFKLTPFNATEIKKFEKEYKDIILDVSEEKVIEINWYKTYTAKFKEYQVKKSVFGISLDCYSHYQSDKGYFIQIPVV